MLGEAYVVGAVRSPVGRRRGRLSAVHPADLGAHVLSGLLARTGVTPEAVDDVIFGCADQVGAQAFNIARTAWLSAGLPVTVPGTTVDRQCGSAQQAMHFAAQAVASGAQDLVIGGGVEVMSLVPIVSAGVVGKAAGLGDPMGGAGWLHRFGDYEFSQFAAAESIADKWAITREQMDEFALESHRRAVEAADAGHFRDEIVAWDDVEADEGPRRDTSLDKLAALEPLTPGGKITAGVSSQISDGAAAVLFASGRAVETYGLRPLAKVTALAVVGSDPHLMLTGPIPATEAVLQRAGLQATDIDLFEINEAFASVVLAWQQEIRVPRDIVNVSGGAIALGHPLGATGARIMTTMLHTMRRTGARYGLQVMCEGIGMANAMIVERLEG
jgi:acetyl-CoA C-acetyltransferase